MLQLARIARTFLKSGQLRPRQYGDSIVLKKCGFHDMANYTRKWDYNLPLTTFDKTIHIEFHDTEHWKGSGEDICTGSGVSVEESNIRKSF